MENQHRQIKGYRELSQEEIDLMNRIKAFGPELQKLTDELRVYLESQYNSSSAEEYIRFTDANPMQWLKIGTQDLQTGLMALTRAVAQPGFF